MTDHKKNNFFKTVVIIILIANARTGTQPPGGFEKTIFLISIDMILNLE